MNSEPTTAGASVADSDDLERRSTPNPMNTATVLPALDSNVRSLVRLLASRGFDDRWNDRLMFEVDGIALAA